MSEFKIDTSEDFGPPLARAPIVEAIIDLRARSSIKWDEAAVKGELEPQLRDYPTVVPQNSMVLGFMLKPGAQTTQHDSWTGLQFKSADERNIATFNRDGFTFSRLTPYMTWDQLETEALRLWQIHCQVARPFEIQRIGVRYINRINFPPGARVELSDYVTTFPSEPKGLEALQEVNFLHIDTFAVPGYPYTLTITRAVQPPQADAWGLILDIDAFVAESIEITDLKTIEKRLAEMRWLKNKAFFGSITNKVKDNCR